jgi:tripartite motif-containing protein 37
MALANPQLSAAIETLSDRLTCIFCLDLAKDPTVLPCCLRVVCASCLDQWCESHTLCPYCRRDILCVDFVRLDWGCDFRKLLGHLQQMTSEASLCQNHHKPTEFFCSECSQYLCSDCLFEELTQKSHTGHSISRMMDIFNALKCELVKSLVVLNSINGQIQQRAISVRQAASRLDLDTAEQIRAMARFAEALRTSSENQSAQYHKALVASADKLIVLSERAKALARPLSGDCDIADVSNVAGVLAEIQRTRLEIEDAIKPSPPPEPQNDILPPFSTAAFVVRDFRAALETARDQTPAVCIYTQTQHVYGNLWRLKIYPFGNMNGRSTHVSVFVEMCRGAAVKAPFRYKIEITSSDPMENQIVHEFRSEFAVNASWGWNKAILIEKVTEHGFLNENGDLTIVLSLKPETYAQACRDLRVAFMEEKARYRSLKLQDRARA